MKPLPEMLHKMLPILLNKSSVIGGITLLSVVVQPFISAATWPALDAQEANVAAAIAKASNGDTVTVPPGLATWKVQELAKQSSMIMRRKAAVIST